MNIDMTTFALPKSIYREEVHEKKQIVLHFTAGFSAAGAFAAFNKRGASTAFIVDRTGQVFQCFDPRFWDCHLIRHEKGEDKRLYDIERQSIGIEIVNVGPLSLSKKPDQKDLLLAWTGKAFCRLSETDKYVQTEYRKRFYYQTFTDGQYIALRELIAELGRRFGITIGGAPPYPRLNYWDLDTQSTYKGVTTHCNYRTDKYDIGPAFDWTRIGLIP